ncbi:UNVERIFIED_CONTAM: hypothetical protein Sradi_0136600 [Sesamum radiatum]|uniref:Uncharacterized protein n=1 Tax=Sesamum radiatum TaxID=300843 RepID=A0AAW2WNA2_SESRA
MGKTRTCAVYNIFLLWMTLQLYCATSSPSQSQTDQGIDVAASSFNMMKRLPGCILHHNFVKFCDHLDISTLFLYCMALSFCVEFMIDISMPHHCLLCIQSHGKCLADLCGALHCDFVMNPQSLKTKCNPAAAARNRHLCENLADSCFPINEGPSATRLHEFFLRQFCDAHTCSRARKPFSRGGRKRTSVFYLAISVLVLMFLPLFYLIVYLYQREMKTQTTQLKRISKQGRKPKPS